MNNEEKFLNISDTDDKLKNLFQNQKKLFFSKIKNSSVEERITKLQKIKKWIFANHRKIIDAIILDLQKPEVEIDLTDIKPVLWEIDLACKKLKKWMQPKRTGFNLAFLGTRSETVIEPVGIVLILSPWNFPFNLTVGPLISAMAAGNCAFIKPSEYSPNCSALIEKMVNELFENSEVIVTQGDPSLAEKLLKLPFNHVFFTGSPEVGKKIMKAAAENLSSVTMELGGCNPAIVDESADLIDAAQKVLYGKLLNSGQSCLSVNFTLVEKTIQKKFIKTLIEEYHKMYPHKNNERDSNISRIVNLKHFKRIERLIKESQIAGAEIVMGGESIESEKYIAPVILNNVPMNASVINEEIFGPVLPVIGYESIEDVLKFLREKPSPLALYIFSNSEKNIKKIVSQTSAGTTCINDTTLQFVHPNLPFGGINNSGIGKAHGYYGFLAFSNLKAVLRQRVGFTAFKMVYPPYTNTKRKIAELIMKYL